MHALHGSAAPSAPRRWTLVYSLLGVCAIVGLVPLSLFAVKLIGITRNALVTSQQEIELQLASSIASQIDTFTDLVERQISTLGDSFGAAIREQGQEKFLADLRARHALVGRLDDQ